MSLPTVNTLDPTWAKVFAGEERGPAHVLRTTTSSRYPGRKIQGVVVSSGKGRMAVCGDCGGKRIVFGLIGDEPGPHAPHWHNGVKVDCAGRPVS